MWVVESNFTGVAKGHRNTYILHLHTARLSHGRLRQGLLRMDAHQPRVRCFKLFESQNISVT